MKVKLRDTARVRNITTLKDLLRCLDTLEYRYSRDTIWYAINLWKSKDSSIELTALSLLDLCNALQVDRRVSNFIEFNDAETAAPEFLEQTPRRSDLVIVSRIDGCIERAGTTRSELRRQRIVSYELLSSFGQQAIDSEKPFFLSSLDKLGDALKLKTIDQLLKIEVADQSLLRRETRKTFYKPGESAYGETTLSA